MNVPETRYAKTIDGLAIAYQALGQGPVDLVYTEAWISNVDARWDVPGFGAFFRQLASISRLILFDRRGSGLSDRPTQVESLALEHGVDDLRAVKDASESERAVLFDQNCSISFSCLAAGICSGFWPTTRCTTTRTGRTAESTSPHPRRSISDQSMSRHAKS